MNALQGPRARLLLGVVLGTVVFFIYPSSDPDQQICYRIDMAMQRDVGHTDHVRDPSAFATARTGCSNNKGDGSVALTMPREGVMYSCDRHAKMLQEANPLVDFQFRDNN